jgi:hypothetical protein
VAFLLFQILDWTLRAKPIKLFFIFFQTFEKVEVVESMYENIYGMVGGALCDHGYQLSVAYYNQAA